jgi:dephospho-CoA kinase
MKIIAICGFQGSGKDTLANILIKQYGYKKLSFGGTVKDVASIIFNWDRKMLEGDSKESREWREKVDDWWSKKLEIKNLTPRYILQQIGTDLFRNNFHKDIWINCLEKKLIDYDKVVITDCRFPNELKILNKYNATIIQIYRGNLPEWFNDVKLGKKDPPKELHESETSWIKESSNYNISNNGTIKELENTIENIMNNDL